MSNPTPTPVRMPKRQDRKRSAEAKRATIARRNARAAKYMAGAR